MGAMEGMASQEKSAQFHHTGLIAWTNRQNSNKAEQQAVPLFFFSCEWTQDLP